MASVDLESEDEIFALRQWLYALIYRAYPVASQFRPGTPEFSRIKVSSLETQDELCAASTLNCGYREFLEKLWREIKIDDQYLDFLISWKLHNEMHQKVWLAIYIEIPEPRLTKADRKILERLTPRTPPP